MGRRMRVQRSVMKMDSDIILSQRVWWSLAQNRGVGLGLQKNMYKCDIFALFSLFVHEKTLSK